jgi:methylthioribose-1-phosphate isomerase
MTDIPGYDTIRWEDDKVILIDQRRLPDEETYLACTDYREVVDAIRTLAIRGAPAIGVAAAMATALGALSFPNSDHHTFQRHFLNQRCHGDWCDACPARFGLSDPEQCEHRWCR